MKKKINKLAKGITKAVGAAPLADYVGTKIAQRKAKGTAAAKYIKQTTTGKQAAKSGVALAANIAGLAAGGAAAGVVKAARVARSGKIPKAIKIAGQAKKMKVKNPGNATQAKRMTRPVKFKITRR